MSATTLPSAPKPPAPAHDAGRVVATVFGALLAFVALIALAVGAVGLWAHTTQRDADGWFNSSWRQLDTSTRALTAEGVDLGDIHGGPEDWVPDLGTVRVRARRSDGGPVFVAIAPEARVDAYLAGVAHMEVDELHRHGVRGTVRPGTRTPQPPADAAGWSAVASGPGTQTARWDPESGRWAAVVMNADASPGVRVDVQVGARARWVGPLAWALLGGGALLGLAAAALLTVGVAGLARPAERPPETQTEPSPAGPTIAAAEPVTVHARLDEPLSRWLWLVKWLLLIPHYVVLAFLWAAFVVLTLVALVAIVATGRYPRALFDFNVGVLRWTWRVGFYGSSALATDRYPPFTLHPADYPAELEIAYPERLSRWKALLKPWLLALPHYLVLSVLLGGWSTRYVPGLLVVLVAIAVIVLAVRGRYPRDLFTLVVGINRWALRVAAYAGLMRDEYPPFRLDR